jgi:hypothetical protein
LGRRLGKTNQDKLEIEQLRQELNLRYERLKGYGNSNNTNQEERAMYGGQKLKERCRHCGVYGHKSNQCWERNPQLRPNSNINIHNKNYNGKYNNRNNRNNSNAPNSTNSNSNNLARFNGSCSYCGIKGH